MSEAYKRQAKLLSEAQESNIKAHREMQKCFLAEATIILECSLVGPYTTIKHYQLSDGSRYMITLASSLEWVDSTDNDWYW